MSKKVKRASSKKTPAKQFKSSETISKEFKIDLTSADYKTLSKKAATLKQEVLARELALKEFNAEKKAKIIALQVQADELVATCGKGWEHRTMKVQVVKDFDAKLIQYWFEGKILEERAMTAEECQLAIPFKKPKKAKELTGAQKTYAKAKGALTAVPKDVKRDDIASAIKDETSRKSKRSSVDGPSSSGSGLYASQHAGNA